MAMTVSYRLRRIAVALPEVVHGDEAGFGRLMERVADERELTELVHFLARCADIAELAIQAGTAVPPKAAHRVFERLRVARQPVPLHIREGERAYQAARKRDQRATGKTKSAAAGERAA